MKFRGLFFIFSSFFSSPTSSYSIFTLDTLFIAGGAAVALPRPPLQREEQVHLHRVPLQPHLAPHLLLLPRKQVSFDTEKESHVENRKKVKWGY